MIYTNPFCAIVLTIAVLFVAIVASAKFVLWLIDKCSKKPKRRYPSADPFNNILNDKN